MTVLIPLTARLPPVSTILFVALCPPREKLRVLLFSDRPLVMVSVATTLFDRFNVLPLPSVTEPLIVLAPEPPKVRLPLATVTGPPSVPPLSIKAPWATVVRPVNVLAPLIVSVPVLVLVKPPLPLAPSVGVSVPGVPPPSRSVTVGVLV